MPHSARIVTSFDTSLFCQQLDKLARQSPGDTRLANLVTATRKLVEHAEPISRQVVRFLPQFTLHDGRHLWNVLGFMEELAGGEEGIGQLGAGDCAMAVWACFLHDLGMVLEAGELAAIEAADCEDLSPGDGTRGSSPDSTGSGPHAVRVQAWRSCRDGHELWESIRHDSDPHSGTSRMKLGIIRAAFVRDTHARLDPHSGHCRIADWLGVLEAGDRLIAQVLEDYALAGQVIRVAVSHNQDIAWLPHQLRTLMDGGEPEADFHAGLGTIHWTWLGWLLRLADVLDCDASRTPPLLFDHGGITDSRSRTEWRKHLSISQAPVWGMGSRGDGLLYTCERSPSPVVEKSLHQIIGWMNEEIFKCRAAWYRMPAEHREGIRLALPGEARVDIKKREGGYLYQDIEFRLDRDAVLELLMGESLYGGPELALRELVQNALDAVHLRDRRNQLATALTKKEGTEKPLQPHEYWPPAESGEVHVEWGTTPDGRSWIRVRDNGVGMTLGTLRRFLTQVGRSYYKSPDFLSEQAQMQRHGIVCSAISQFGIGFLSVFMLADQVEIHTRPVDSEARPDKTKPDWEETGRFPFRAEIHGPHGLLAFYPDETVERPGTTVTLWLKRGDHGEKPFVLPEWDRDVFIARLQKEFYGKEPGWELRIKMREKPLANDSLRILDPAFEIGRLTVWPLYPVHLVPPPPGGGITLDDRFHFSVLAPLDRGPLAEAAVRCRENLPEAETAEWKACDWVDEGTGSRVRLVVAQPAGELAWSAPPEDWASLPEIMGSGKSRLALLTLSEENLPEHGCRYQCLVNGIRIVPGLVPSAGRDGQLSRILQDFPGWPGTGGWLWLDLQGQAAPRLRADRSSITRSQPAAWNLQRLTAGWLEAWRGMLPLWLRSAVILPAAMQRKAAGEESFPLRLGADLLDPQLLCGNLFSELKSSKALAAILGENACGRIVRDPALVLGAGFEFWQQPKDSLNSAPDFAIAHVKARPRILSNLLVAARGAALGLTRALVRNFQPGIPALLDPVLDIDRRAHRMDHQRLRPFLRFLQLHPLSECLQPNLDGTHPALGWHSPRGRVADYESAGPMHIRPAGSGKECPWLVPYDLSAPFTVMAFPRLRKLCPSWMEDRGERLLFLLPLLLGKELRELLTMKRRMERRLEGDQAFGRLMLFLPNPDHYEWLFHEHTEEEWAQGSASVLSDLETGEVVYADGIHTEASLRAEGRPLRVWLGIADTAASG